MKAVEESFPELSSPIRTPSMECQPQSDSNRTPFAQFASATAKLAYHQSTYLSMYPIYIYMHDVLQP